MKGMEIVKLYTIDINTAFHHKKALLEKISDSQKEKAMKFKNEIDQVRSAVGSLLIQRFAGKEEILIGPKGKPYFANGPFFNLSHAGEYVGLAVSDEEVGFDLENIERCDLSIVRAAFTAEEGQRIHSKQDFALAWTQKEAVAKCLGDGLTNPRLSGVEDLGDGRFQYEGETYFIDTLPLDGHYLSVATKKAAPEIQLEVIPAQELLKQRS